MATEVPDGRRCYVISITPFTEGGDVDENAYRAHLQRMGQAGIGVYVGGGGSGEGYTLTVDETVRLQEIAVAELGGRVPVRAMGVEPRTAAEMIAFVARARGAGVDAVQVYSLDVGHGHAPTPAELEAYFGEVLASTDLPCVISTHQSVGYKVPVRLMESLAGRFDHLVGINCSQQDLEYLASLVEAVGERLSIHVGGPMQALTALSFGATGFLSSEANLAPNLCAAVGRAYDEGDTATMMRAFATVVRLSAALYGQGGIRATKAVLGRLGLPGGVPRRPRLPLDDQLAIELRSRIADLGVDGWEPWGQLA
ncbi:MAG TPA: dihydrodipicolinate synthase family protein [Acidimicrobiales bacterium]|jgi:4-hydroxy-tetrahydrodipicolinate synthase|nr:dihydrodipicolinate synthase family protein [Acidimicrobiales bacterium]